MSTAGESVSARVLRLGARIRSCYFYLSLFSGVLAFRAVSDVVAEGATWWRVALVLTWAYFCVENAVSWYRYMRRVDRGDWVGVLHGG